jgi:uncharacterized repeat protein (TIGR01451 family)
MKKLLLFSGPLLISSLSYAQIQGDISNQSTAMSNFHYDAECFSEVSLTYMVTISNSFVGDSVKVVDPNSGTILFAEENTSGQNPWFVNAPLPFFTMVSDQDVFNNIGHAGFPNAKIISGPDTLFASSVGSFYVSNPCTYGNVSGKAYIDANNDCTFNTGDTPLAGININGNVNVTNVNGSYTLGWVATSSLAGDYLLNLQESWMTDYTVQLPSNYQFIFPASTCSPTSQTFNSLPQAGVDFALQCEDIDVSCDVYSSGAVRPAIPFKLLPRVMNLGCDAASGVLKLVLDPRVAYNPALSTNLPNSILGDTLIWNYNNLSNLSNGAYWSSFMPSLHLTPNLSVNIGDVLCFQIFSTVPSNDIDPTNNQSSRCFNVVNSYDPNVKEVSPKGIGAEGFIPDSVNEFTYTIHFQNTGNAPAINVYIVDSLEQHVDPATLKIVAASHAMNPSWLASNVVKFNFSNINLPDSVSNEPSSHGFVTFKIGLANALQPGDEIKNKAHIYFDTNPAIITNTAINTVTTNLGINDTKYSRLDVYPNPSGGIYNIKLPENTSGNNTLTVYNIAGQPIQSINMVKYIAQIDISNFPNGIYIVVMNGEHSFKQILVKQ